MDDLGDPLMVKEGCVRGLGWGLEHALRSVEIDRRGFVGAFHDNILPELLHVCWSGELGSWMDDYLEDYMLAVHSTAALAVNSFGPLMLDDVAFSLCGHKELKVERFENGLNDPDLGEPHLDVVARGDGGTVVIVPCCIDYVLRHVPLPWAKRSAAELANQGTGISDTPLPVSQHGYRWLGAERLIKWSRRLAEDGAPATVVYLYWEPMDECLSPIFEEHREEVSAFLRRPASGAVRFEALTFFELWNVWADTGGPRLQRLAATLRARYEVPAWAWEGVSWVNGRLNNSGLDEW